MTELPNGPWKHIYAYIFGELISKEYVLVVQCLYSDFPVVEIITSTSASANIPTRDNIMANFGIPYKLNTDNATPFNSQNFANFAKHKGLEHTKITPCAPGANDMVDCFMRNLWKVLKTSHIDNHNWKTAFQCFLCLYGTTLHCITEYPLAQLLFNKTRLPNSAINTDLLQHKEVTEINSSQITGTNKTRMIKRHITFFKHYILASNQHQHPKPQRSTTRGVLSPSTSSNEGDQSDSSRILYNKQEEEVQLQRGELETSPWPQPNRRKPVRYRNK